VKENKYQFFPHENPRTEQDVIINHVYDFIRDEFYSGLILSGDPGIGKEACMTSQALLALSKGMFDLVIFTIPTDSGKANILKELNAVKHGKRVVKITSKETLCTWIKDKEDNQVRAIEEGEKCAFLLCKSQGSNCKYKDNGCLYEKQKEEIKDAEILICDYNYIISPFIRKFSGIGELMEKKKTLLLINECHRLPARAEGILSNSLSSKTIEHAIKELDKYGFQKEKNQVVKLRDGLQKGVNDNFPDFRKQIDVGYSDYATIIIMPQLISSLCGDGSSLISAGEKITDMKFKSNEGILSYAGMVGGFFEQFNKKKKYHKYTIYFVKLNNDLETKQIGWTPAIVGGYIKNALDLVDKYILYSGTCSPEKFKHTIGLSKSHVLTPERVESPFLKNRKDIILNCSRFKAEKTKSGEFIQDVETNINKILSRMPKPIAVVCTNSWYKNINFVSNILNEPKTQSEVSEWLENMAKKADVIRFSPYGRVSQSVDMSFLRSILFIGFPFGSYNNITQEKIKRLTKSFKGRSGNPNFAAHYITTTLPACEVVIQSAMRGLRSEKDRLVVVYYDKQFQLNKGLINSKNLEICSSVKEVTALLRKI